MLAVQRSHFATSANPSKGGSETYDLVRRKVDKLMKQAPQVKKELAKQIPRFNLLDAKDDTIMERSVVPPDRVLKSIDTTFESFFYQRKYTERNFCFYLQACAQQYKPEEAQKAFDRMQSLGIRPTDHTYTQLQLAYAKVRDLDKVLALHDEAQRKHGLAPSINRMSSVLLAYCRVGKLQEAEALMREMRE